MAYRMSFDIKGLPDYQPKVSAKVFNEISSYVYENGKRLNSAQRETALPYTLCLYWIAYIYQAVFKNRGCEYCPIKADYFMVRFYGKPDADKGVARLKRFMDRHKGLTIEITKGG